MTDFCHEEEKTTYTHSHRIGLGYGCGNRNRLFHLKPGKALDGVLRRLLRGFACFQLSGVFVPGA
jgi:hypothetical protein